MGIKIEGGITGTPAEVNTANELKTAQTLDYTAAGFSTISCEADAGSVTGVRSTRNPDIDEDYRMRVAVDTMLFGDSFTGTALNTNVWDNPSTTMTTAVSNGFVTLNSGSSTATTVYAMVRSKPMFYSYGQFGASWECIAIIAQVPQSNNITEWGAAVVATNATPTDGAYFRLTSAGTFVCVANYGGTEVTAIPAGGFAALIGAGNAHHYVIVMSDDEITYWIDDVMVAEIPRQTGAGSITTSGSLSFFARTNNTGATGLAQQIKIGMVSVSLMSANTTMPWDLVLSRNGQSPYQSQSGSTVAATVAYTNNTNPTAGVPTNTTSTVITGCGGIGWETLTLAVATDGIICSWQVPAGAAGVPGRTFLCYGAKVSSGIQTVLAGGPFIESWTLNYGGSALSLATTDGATSKAHKRVPMGQRAVTATAAVSTMLADVELRLTNPVAVYPGEYICVSKRVTGTVGTSGTAQHTVTFYGILI